MTLALCACGYAPPPTQPGLIAGETLTSPPPAGGEGTFDTGINLPQVTLPDGLKFANVKVGTGAVVKSGDTVSVQYTGWLSDGTEFDSSWSRGQPFTTPIGTGYVIPGWDEGMVGMRVGGVRRLVIPPALAYGANPPSGSVIPANATLVFLVQLLSVTQGTATPSPSPSP